MFNPMIEFIKCAVINSPTKNKHITVIFKHREEAPSAAHILTRIKEQIDCKASGVNSLEALCIIEREQEPREKIHNRYMISDLGALIWGIGLDEESSEISDDVVLMNDDLYNVRYRQYCELSVFDLADSAKETF